MKLKIDTLVVNGTIYTLEREGETVEAMGLKDGRIVFCGDRAEADRCLEADETVDLAGKTVLPGMGDSHLHFYAYCQTFTTVDLGGAKSKTEVIRRLREKAAVTPEGQWIKGSNFDQSKWEGEADRIPTRRDLDEASTKHPIVIKRVCLHTAVANTAALERAGIGRDYDFGLGGTVELEGDGMPSGILREQSSKIFDELIPDPMEDPELKRSTMIAVLKDASSRGLTMLHTYAAEIWKYIERIEDYEALDREGLLPLRVTVCLDRLFDKPELTAGQRSNPNRKVQYGAYKLFTDGSLGSRSAALFEAYEDDPGNCGILVTPQKQLDRKLSEAYGQGLQPAIHCIGDRGLDSALTAIERCLETAREDGMTEEEQNARPPFRLIHVQLVSEELIARMKKLPVVLDIQPVFLVTDLHWIEERVGKKRAEYSYLWKRLMEEGLLETGSSDCPVESFDPFAGIYAAVTRQDFSGFPEGGYMPGQKLTMYEALCMYSKNIPYANGEQDLMGTLRIGKFADFIVADRDPFKIEPQELLRLKVEQTWLAGKRVFTRA